MYLLLVFLLYTNLFSEVRECLKLDPDHKDCYKHYKSVKKLFKAGEAGKKLMAESR